MRENIFCKYEQQIKPQNFVNLLAFSVFYMHASLFNIVIKKNSRHNKEEEEDLSTPCSSFPFWVQRKGKKEGAVSSSVFVFLLAPASVLPLLELSDLLSTFCLPFGVQNHAFLDFWKEPVCCRRRYGCVSLFWALLPNSKSPVIV